MNDEIVVLELAGDICVLGCEDAGLAGLMAHHGFHASCGKLYKPISDLESRLQTVKVLIAAGALFSHGRSASPAEIVRTMGELGLLSATFRTVAWLNPDVVLIRVCGSTVSGAWAEAVPAASDEGSCRAVVGDSGRDTYS